MGEINKMTGENIKQIVYNTSMSAKEIINKGSEKGINYLASNSQDIFTFFFLPLIILIALLLVLKYSEEIRNYVNKKLSTNGYVKIFMRLHNKELKEVMIKLDAYNNFNFRKGKYNLDKMYNFIFAYKNGVPIIIYDINYFLPCKIDNDFNVEKIKNELLEGIKENEDLSQSEVEEIINKKVRAIKLKINPKIIKTVYDKKLVEDLYKQTTSSNDFFNKYGLYILIAIGILILYVSGYLTPIMNYVFKGA